MKFYKQESKVEEFYAKLTERYPKGIVDAVYEDAIIDCIGINGLRQATKQKPAGFWKGENFMRYD